jgi:septum formation protein
MERRPLLALASASPRRRVLLRRGGYAFAVTRPEIDERPRPGEPPPALVARLAAGKAAAGAAGLEPPCLVLGADTAVVLDARALGKPQSDRDAVGMLMELGGRTHEVLTAYCLANHEGRPLEEDTVTTLVTFRPIRRSDAEAYVATGEPRDKAGAYAIQGLGRRFVSRLDGSFTNVMGLPMDEVAAALARHGVLPETS